MAYIYAMSDIHGEVSIFKKALSLIDLHVKDNKLILLGDYIDQGNRCCEMLYFIKELQEENPAQVVVLMGNHEKMFLDYLISAQNDIWNYEWLKADDGFKTIKSFVLQNTMDKVLLLKEECREYYLFLMESSKVIKEDIMKNHKGLIRWLKKCHISTKRKSKYLYMRELTKKRKNIGSMGHQMLIS